jgi:hypothetical protein
MKIRRSAGTGALALLALLAVGCASSSTLHFRCEPVINDELLLTTDVIVIQDSEIAAIRDTGDEWFYSELRRQLEPRTRTVAVEGGCDTAVQIAPRKGYDTLAVISDYKGAGSATGNMRFLRKEEWKGKKLQVKVGAGTLTIQGGR